MANQSHRSPAHGLPIAAMPKQAATGFLSAPTASRNFRWNAAMETRYANPAKQSLSHDVAVMPAIAQRRGRIPTCA